MPIISFRKLSDPKGFARVNSHLMSELSHESIERALGEIEACYSIPAISPTRYSMFAPYSQVKLMLDRDILSLKCKLSFWILVPSIAVFVFMIILLLKKDIRFDDVLTFVAFACFVTGFALISSYVRIRSLFNE